MPGLHLASQWLGLLTIQARQHNALTRHSLPNPELNI
jgi:hypothetical protein